MCPVIELAVRGAFDVVGKFLNDLVVENLVLAEPHVHAAIDLWGTQIFLLKPETQNFIDANLIIGSDSRLEGVAKKFYWHFRKPPTSV